MRVIKTDPPAPDGWQIGALCNLCDEAVSKFVLIKFGEGSTIICASCVKEMAEVLLEKYPELDDSRA